MSEELDLALGILDHQLLDRDGRRCGNVDDLAIEGGPGEDAEVVAILSGPGVWPNGQAYWDGSPGGSEAVDASASRGRRWRKSSRTSC